jgi:uroporphyrinogen decarboxylase
MRYEHMMTPKERVIAQIQHKETDGIPYTLGFEGDVAERLDEHYGSSDWRDKLDPHIRHVPAVEFGSVDTEAAYLSTDVFGTVWRVDLRPWHLEVPALKEPTLEGYEFPPTEAFFSEGWRERALEVAADYSDYFLVAGFGFGLFERTWCMRGFMNALMDVLGNPGFYRELVARIADSQMEIIEELLTLPVDGIMFSDDWGDQRGVILGPDRWRELLKPHLARMYDLVHSAGKYTLSHCCGNCSDVIPDAIEIGLDVLESVQPEAMDPYELKRAYGEHLTFWGGLGSQSVIPFGRPEDIHREVSKLCAEMDRGGGYILSPAKALQPETPTENAAAVVEAFLAQAGLEV